MEVDIVEEEAGVVVDAHLVSMEHSRINTSDSPVLMMAEQLKHLEIITTATHTDGTYTLVMTVPMNPLMKGETRFTNS